MLRKSFANHTNTEIATQKWSHEPIYLLSESQAIVHQLKIKKFQ